MNSIASILSGTGHPTGSLRWAGELARTADLRLRVINVFEPTYAEVAPDWYEELVAARRAAIEATLRETGITDAEVTVLQGHDQEDAIANQLAENSALLVVIDAQRQGASRDGVDLARQLLHHTGTAVAIVPPAHEPLAQRTILVGVDGSGANATALRFAEDLASWTNSSIDAVFAYDPIDDTYTHPDGWHRNSNEVRTAVEKVTKVPLELYLAAGHPTQVLLEHADRERVAAIVVGTRGRGGFENLRLGRVPGQLIDHARCPLIVVPH